MADNHEITYVPLRVPPCARSPGQPQDRGAEATAILLSITRTIRQHDLPMIETFKDMLMAS